MLSCQRLFDRKSYRSPKPAPKATNGYRLFQNTQNWLCGSRRKQYEHISQKPPVNIQNLHFQSLKHLLEMYNEDKVKLVFMNLNKEVRDTLEKVAQTEKMKHCHSSSTLYDGMFDLTDEDTRIPLMECWFRNIVVFKKDVRRNNYLVLLLFKLKVFRYGDVTIEWCGIEDFGIFFKNDLYLTCFNVLKHSFRYVVST